MSADALADWALSAGGIRTDPESPYNFDLPDDFTGWTKSDVVMVVDEGTSWGWDESVIPAFTQGYSARIEFALDGDRAESIVQASASGVDSSNPTTAMAQGLVATFGVTFDAQDSEGYTVTMTVNGRLQPFTAEVADSPPGKFKAVAVAIVGGSVTNTTSDRNTESTGTGVVALYAADSEICGGSANISVEGADWNDGSFCTVGIGNIAGGTLAPGATQKTEQLERPLTFGDFDESGNALAQANKPAAIFALFGGKGLYLTGVEWTSSKGCKVQTKAGGTWAVPMDGWPDVLCN
jgi:hypothetical protein